MSGQARLTMDPEMAGAEARPQDCMPKGEPMVLAVVGWREMKDRRMLYREADAICHLYGRPDLVISGGAPGADTLAQEWTSDRKLRFQTCHPESTHAYRTGRSMAVAFAERDQEIARACSHMLAFPHLELGKGTQLTVKMAQGFAKRRRKTIFVVPLSQ